MPRFGAFVVLLVCIALGSAAATAYITVDPTTRFFMDEQGRTRLFHGLNAVYKVPPWYPPQEGFDAQTSFSQEDVDNLVAWGFNFVRLGVMWPGVMPDATQQINATYLAAMAALVQRLGDSGIYVLLDLHQDLISRYFCGEGAPDWLVDVAGDGARAFPIPSLGDTVYPVAPDTGYPALETCLNHTFAIYYPSDQVGATFQRLYDNGGGMQDALAAYWDAVSGYFNQSEAVLGYEILNEPWPGDIYADPELLVVPGLADKTNLAPMYERINTVIRGNDQNHIVFYEKALNDLAGEVGWPRGFPGGEQYLNRQAYSYHIYCAGNRQGDPTNVLQCGAALELQWATAMDDAAKLGGGSFMTEFGAVDNQTAGIDLINAQTAQADFFLQSWAYWQFKYFHDLTTSSAQLEGLYQPDGNLQTDKLRALSRTYAQAISGTPVAMAFLPHTGEFSLQYDIVDPDTAAAAPTVIYLNELLWYPNGYSVSLQPHDAASWSAPATNTIAVVTRAAGVQPGTRITVQISPN